MVVVLMAYTVLLGVCGIGVILYLIGLYLSRTHSRNHGKKFRHYAYLTLFMGIMPMIVLYLATGVKI